MKKHTLLLLAFLGLLPFAWGCERETEIEEPGVGETEIEREADGEVEVDRPGPGGETEIEEDGKIDN